MPVSLKTSARPDNLNWIGQVPNVDNFHFFLPFGFLYFLDVCYVREYVVFLWNGI